MTDVRNRNRVAAGTSHGGEFTVERKQRPTISHKPGLDDQLLAVLDRYGQLPDVPEGTRLADGTQVSGPFREVLREHFKPLTDWENEHGEPYTVWRACDMGDFPDGLTPNKTTPDQTMIRNDFHVPGVHGFTCVWSNPDLSHLATFLDADIRHPHWERNRDGAVSAYYNLPVAVDRDELTRMACLDYERGGILNGIVEPWVVFAENTTHAHESYEVWEKLRRLEDNRLLVKERLRRQAEEFQEVTGLPAEQELPQPTSSCPTSGFFGPALYEETNDGLSALRAELSARETAMSPPPATPPDGIDPAQWAAIRDEATIMKLREKIVRDETWVEWGWYEYQQVLRRRQTAFERDGLRITELKARREVLRRGASFPCDLALMPPDPRQTT